MRLLSFFILLLLNTKGNAQEYQFNPCNSDSSVISHHYFSFAYSEQAELPKWVAYKLSNDNFSASIERSNDFREDTLVLSGSASLADYHGSGYDRGHLAPAGSMKVNEESMSESFLMTNICPQLPSFNRGVWKRLEEKVRYWTESNDSIYVISGPILNNPIDTIGANEVFVPRAFFKTLIAFKGDKITGIAFLMPHESSSNSLYSFATSIDEIEELTGIDFYCNLNLHAQDTIESNGKMKDFLFIK